MRHAIAWILALSCAYAPACAAGPSLPLVAAFYYPWFATTTVDGNYAHWSQYGHLPPNDISSVYYPSLGVYSSDDPRVLLDQMAENERAGVDQIAVSRWGKGVPEDGRAPAILGAARAEGIGGGIHIEPYRGRSVASV